MSGKGWGTTDDGSMGGHGIINVISNNRCNLAEGLLKLRTIVSYVYGHIRSDLDQEQLEGDPKTGNQNMMNKIITALNQTYISGEFVLLKQNKLPTNPTVVIADPAGSSYNGARFGYSVAAGGFEKHDSKGKWIGNTSRDVALAYSQATFDDQYGERTRVPLLLHNMLHATIRESLIGETMMTITESWERTMRLIHNCLTDKYAPRALWSVTVDDERIDVEVNGPVRGVGRNGSLRVEEEHKDMWHFYWNDLLLVALDTRNRSYERPNTTAKITRIVQCPFTGAIAPDSKLLLFDWGMWPTHVSCTSYDKQTTFVMVPGDFKSTGEMLEIIAWDGNRQITGNLYNGDSVTNTIASIRDTTQNQVDDYDSFQESRASVVHNTCCSITLDSPSSTVRGVDNLTRWVADSYADPTTRVPDIPDDKYTLVPLSRDDQWSKSSPPALLLRFGTSAESPKSWCVGGQYGQEINALEAAISWADATDEQSLLP
jgi:hypothetical protein